MPGSIRIFADGLHRRRRSDARSVLGDRFVKNQKLAQPGLHNMSWADNEILKAEGEDGSGPIDHREESRPSHTVPEPATVV
jgi:hypothetical protein